MGRYEKRAPLKTPAWEAIKFPDRVAVYLNFRKCFALVPVKSLCVPSEVPALVLGVASK